MNVWGEIKCNLQYFTAGCEPPPSSNLLALPNQFQKRIAVEFQNVLSQEESVAKSLFENNKASLINIFNLAKFHEI